jgi:hypothetical protein
MMAKNIEALAKKLGATVVGKVPDYSAGAFGMAALANWLSGPTRSTMILVLGKRAGRIGNGEDTV